MDWKTIHAYAVEAELWSTLAINAWIIVSAAIVAFSWSRHEPHNADTVVRAANYAFRIVGIAAAAYYLFVTFVVHGK